MAENKTQPTPADVDAFLDAVEPARRRTDGKELRDMMARLSGEPAVMWGPSIVGFGTHHYRYASGREGDMCRIGFSPRKARLVLYLSCDLDRFAPLRARLGKHERGVGCLYIKSLDDVDRTVLKEMIARALDPAPTP